MKIKLNGEKVYSIMDIAKAIGRNHEFVRYRVVGSREWPDPTEKVGKRLYYEESVFNTICKVAMREMEEKKKAN